MCEYYSVWQQMKMFTRNRNSKTEDEIWLLEHYPVYTTGVSCNDTPTINPAKIPLVHSDRGGKITYHGPGQIIIYFLLDLRRRKIGTKALTQTTEQLAIDFLLDYKLTAKRMPQAPGVYVQEKKIAALGFRISNMCSYHGLSINVNMDISPFSYIAPCGYPDLEVTQLIDYVPGINKENVTENLVRLLEIRF